MSTIHLRRFVAAMILFVFSSILIACEEVEEPNLNVAGIYNQGIESIIDSSVYTEKVPNIFTDDDEDFVDHASNDFKFDNTAIVILDDDNTAINNAVDETEIYMEDGNLIVNSTKKMTLILKGTLHGNVQVYKPDGKFKLVLDGVDITSDSGPAINIQSEKRSFLVLEEGSVNTLSDGFVHPTLADGSNTDGALFSEEQIIISGTGELNITANFKHGIVSDDYIKILSGTIQILSAPVDGLHANDYIVIDGGDVTINANSNGIECIRGYVVINGGKVTIDAVSDGIKTSYQDNDSTIYPFIHILNGIIHINVDAEGIASTSDINIQGGNLIIESLDDAISSDARLSINGGVHSLKSIEKQALDGDEYVKITGGISMLLAGGFTASIESDEGIISIDGGTVVTAGPTVLDLSNSTQGYVGYVGVQENDTLQLKQDSTLLTVGFLTDYTYVVMSTPEMIPGEDVELYSNGSISGDNFYGIFEDAIFSNGELIETLIIN